MSTLWRATNWVGDVAMSLPALKAWRASFPTERLTILARPWVADLYRTLPAIDEVLVDDRQKSLVDELRSRSFQRALVFPTSFRSLWAPFRAGISERIGYGGDFRSPLLTRVVRSTMPHDTHQVWQHLRLVEAAGAGAVTAPDSSWEVPESLRLEGRKRLEETGWDGRPFLAAHVASFAHAAKRWDLARYAELFDHLARSRGLAVVLLGSSGEAGVNAQVRELVREARLFDLSGRSTLPELLGILSSASLFVGNDSGISHLAAAVGIPTTVLFGPTDPDATRPWDGARGDGKPVRISFARKRPLCAPCRFPVCPIDHRCMKVLSVSEVLVALEKLF